MMKKVLFVATVATHIRGFHTPYLKLFKEKGYKTFVAADWNLEDNKTIDYCDEFIQLSIQRSPYSTKNLKAIKELKILIEKEKFDIIHCHTPMGGVVARLAARKARKKYHTRVIYTAHGFHFFKGAPKLNWILFYPIEKWLAKYTDTLITINKEDYNLAKKKFSKRCHDIQYVPGVGIDIKRFDIKMTNKEKKDFKKSLGLKENDYVLTCVARLDKNKNQGFLIKVMEQLVKEHKDIHLLLVGPDELNGYYQKNVDDKKLNDNIHFTGRREDIPQILAISDIVVSASHREGLPVNVMEALAAGKPVVALKCRGIEDLIVNGENGYIIENNNMKLLNKYIYVLLKNRNRTNIVEKNNIKKSNFYSVSKIINDYYNIYFNEINIPKIVHYIWMGRKPMPKNIIKCMKTWNKLYDYEIKEWNEDNFNLDEHPFCKKAYENKKWAFVSDYVRAWVIYNYGGIYFDTDILVIDENLLNISLKYSAFVGYENRFMPFTAVFGAVKGHPFVKKMLDHYETKGVDLKTTNTKWVSDILINDYNCKLDNKEQDLKDDIHVYPKEVLCEPSKKSATIHAFTGTWIDKRSIFGKISTFLRINSNLRICRIIYSKIIVPIKEKRNEKIYYNNNSNL